MSRIFTLPNAVARHRLLLGVLAVALVVRLLLVWAAAGTPLQIVDEQHYATIAANMVAGHGFVWAEGQPTSIRPPLFPAFVAGLWSLAGPGNLTAVRVAHIPVALASIVILYVLGLRLYGQRPALLAAAAFAFYPSLLFSGVVLLTETLFVFWLLLVVLGCVVLLERPSGTLALATGAALGAAALTRSVMWPFVLPLCAYVLFAWNGSPRRRVILSVCLAAGFAIVVAPWAIRNTRLQGTFTVVDTMGGLNLMMGNYAHTPEDRPWDAVSLTGDKAWSAQLPPRAPDGQRWTEGTKEKWAREQARNYMLAHPGVTLRRAALKFADFWGIEREFIAGVRRGLYAPPAWFFVPAGILTALACMAALVMGAIGACVAPPKELRAHLLILGIVAFVAAVHTVIFAHARYHVPLIPLLLLYAAALVQTNAVARWRVPVPRLAASALAVLLLAGIWAREVLVRDAHHIAQVVALIGGQ